MAHNSETWAPQGTPTGGQKVEQFFHRQKSFIEGDDWTMASDQNCNGWKKTLLGMPYT